METFDLIAHPAHPPVGVRQVQARIVSCDAWWCVLRWKITGAEQVSVPPLAGRARADGRWQTTCFELFVAPGCARVDTGYSEYNFSPSERWAAYDFDGYRSGRKERAVSRAPVITPRRGGAQMICDVAIPAAALPARPWRYGLTAVIAEVAGDGPPAPPPVLSYWAMAHGGPRPDFHDPACLGGVLAAPVEA